MPLTPYSATQLNTTPQPRADKCRIYCNAVVFYRCFILYFKVSHMHTYMQLDVNTDIELPLMYIHSCTHHMQEHYLSLFLARVCAPTQQLKRRPARLSAVSTSCISVSFQLVVY